MCIGIPMRIVEVTQGGAIAERRGRREALNTLLIADLAPGEFVLAHQGSALRILSPDEAARTDQALDAMEAALAGVVDFDAYFPDLADRLPELPAHLKQEP